MVQVPNFVASGNISPSRFVSISGNKTVAQAAVGSDCIGISQRGTRDTPVYGASTYAGIADSPMSVYGIGEMCSLEAGGVVTAGQFLKPDASGRGVAIAGGEAYYAQALTPAAASGELLDVYICRGMAPEPVVAVTAAGSTQANAAALTGNSLNNVAGADGTKGVVLPAAVAGLRVRVYSSVATNGLKIYPASGDDINDGTTDAAIIIEGKTVALLVAVDDTTWTADYTVNT